MLIPFGDDFFRISLEPGGNVVVGGHFDVGKHPGKESICEHCVFLLQINYSDLRPIQGNNLILQKELTMTAYK